MGRAQGLCGSGARQENGTQADTFRRETDGHAGNWSGRQQKSRNRAEQSVVVVTHTLGTKGSCCHPRAGGQSRVT